MQIDSVIAAHANPTKAKILSGFFKTAKGEYGEGDVFLGITVPVCREIAKAFAHFSLKGIKTLLQSEIHEKRLVALLILVGLFQKAEKQKDTSTQKKVFDFYLSNLDRVNNWDLVDLTASNIAGKYLLGKDSALLYGLAKSSNLWSRRVAVVSTFAFIQNHEFQPTLEITELLLKDSHDLIHKACGWMLREVGKKDAAVLEKFLAKHCKKMPRTMLRYAIERLPLKKRRFYMAK